MTKGKKGREGRSRSSLEGQPPDSGRQRPEIEERRPSTRRPNRDADRAQGGGFAYVVVPAVIVAVLGIGVLWFTGSQKSSGANQSQSVPAANEQASLLTDVAWPTYVSRGPSSVKEAYQYAVQRPDVLNYMPCYCGCGQHNGHRSNEECFIANMNQGGRTIAFEQHGST